MTKNTSTPIKPPLNILIPLWKNITGITAIARKPSIFARYFKLTIL